MPGMEMANWNWKVVRQFVSKRFGIGLSRSACLNYPHRLGFVLKRPKKRLVKADEQKREAFAAAYAALSDEAWRTGAKIFFAGEAHFRADAELRGKWVLKGEPAPRFHEGGLWWTRPARAMAKRPATTRQCAWRSVRACPRENWGSRRKPVLGKQGPGRGPGCHQGQRPSVPVRDRGRRVLTPARFAEAGMFLRPGAATVTGPPPPPLPPPPPSGIPQWARRRCTWDRPGRRPACAAAS